MTVEAIEYDHKGNIVEAAQFRYLEDAIEWCEHRRGAKFEQWGDREIGFQLMMTNEFEHHFATDEFPERWYEIHGLTEHGELRELTDKDNKIPLPRAKPLILLYFDDTGCEWHSDGWGSDQELMTKARDAIRTGKTREEVIELLSESFTVAELKDRP